MLGASARYSCFCTPVETGKAESSLTSLLLLSDRDPLTLGSRSGRGFAAVGNGRLGGLV